MTDDDFENEFVGVIDGDVPIEISLNDDEDSEDYPIHLLVGEDLDFSLTRVAAEALVTLLQAALAMDLMRA